jgi:hypothetical protein
MQGIGSWMVVLLSIARSGCNPGMKNILESRIERMQEKIIWAVFRIIFRSMLKFKNAERVMG